jgi:hypothetical protein
VVGVASVASASMISCYSVDTIEQSICNEANCGIKDCNRCDFSMLRNNMNAFQSMPWSAV